MIFILLSLVSWANTSAGPEICDFGASPQKKWASHPAAEMNWGPGGVKPKNLSHLVRLDSKWKAKVKDLIQECPTEESQILQFLERANESCFFYLRIYQFKDEGSVIGDLLRIAPKTTGYKRQIETLEQKGKGCKRMLPFLRQTERLSENSIKLAIEKVSTDQCAELARIVNAERLTKKCASADSSGASGL